MTHDNPDAHDIPDRQDDADKRPDPGPRANQGFGAPGSPSEQQRGVDSNPPAGAAGKATADQESQMKPPAKDGLDPQKTRKSDQVRRGDDPGRAAERGYLSHWRAAKKGRSG